MPKNSSVLIFYYILKIIFFCKNKMKKIRSCISRQVWHDVFFPHKRIFANSRKKNLSCAPCNSLKSSSITWWCFNLHNLHKYILYNPHRPTCQWFKDGVKLTEKSHQINSKERTLTVKNASPDDNGLYYCCAKNAAGHVCSSSNFSLNIIGVFYNTAFIQCLELCWTIRGIFLMDGKNKKELFYKCSVM